MVVILSDLDEPELPASAGCLDLGYGSDISFPELCVVFLSVNLYPMLAVH